MPREEQLEDASTGEGVKDTIESIVVALILAFVFRAFVVEAFVIPTGSMAATLYGAHGTIICNDCGTEFAYGLKDLGDRRNIPQVRPDASAICPNCNHPNTNLKINDTRRNPEKGDRILVLKWPFDIGYGPLQPSRWDVIVFKDPADGTTNFIKRLVGMPNEVLMILDGDVYTVPTEELSEGMLAQLDRLRQQKYELRTGRRKGRLERLPTAVKDELDRKMTVVRKTPQAQQALWLRVYDHDYPPQTPDRYQPRWEPVDGSVSGWDARNRRVRFEDRRLEHDYIELKGKAVRADCAYNINRKHSPPVSDQRVRFVLTPRSNEGMLRIRLSKLGRTFWATVEMNGRVGITESADGRTPSGTINLSKQLRPFTVGKSVAVSFENVDYRLGLRVRNEEVLATSSEPDSDGYYGPNLTRLRLRRRVPPSSTPQLYGAGGGFELSHLVVERDVYYYHPIKDRALNTLSWAPQGGWGGPESPLLLRENEYFMLGDNTAASKDSRLWDQWGPHMEARGEDYQLGTVPGDQLIGKAFFVYWPSPTRIEWLDWLPVIGGNVVPDVGRMRWIR